jgi:hypothetical protein
MMNMKAFAIGFLFLLGVVFTRAGEPSATFAGVKSVREFGVTPTATAAENAKRMQAGIDWAAKCGGLLYVDPSDEPYPVDGGLILRRNASIVGGNGPVGRGTCHPEKDQPVGSVFRIEDTEHPFITVEGGTQLRGLQFWYAKQTVNDPAKIIPYPPTLQVSKENAAQGVMLSCLTFFGECLAMDFRAKASVPCELMTFEHCYGYPLSGRFIMIDHCYDIPRILHCHVNPSNQRYFKGGFSRSVVDAVVAHKTYSYWLDHTDNAQMVDVFAFGVYGGIYLGPATYGQLSNFNLDCVTVGLFKGGDNTFNRNWQIAQGSIIANTGERIADIHPIIIEGQGHTALVNVEAFSGPNGAVTALGQSQDFMLVRGNQKLTVSMSGCRMRNYAAAQPITRENTNALIQAALCLDKNEEPYSLVK